MNQRCQYGTDDAALPRDRTSKKSTIRKDDMFLMRVMVRWLCNKPQGGKLLSHTKGQTWWDVGVKTKTHRVRTRDTNTCWILVFFFNAFLVLRLILGVRHGQGMPAVACAAGVLPDKLL